MGLGILVTGGAGYVGSILVPRLLDEGCRVTVLDNFLYRQTTLLECCSNERFEVIRGDARDERVVRNALVKADFILPLAAIVGWAACAADPFAAVSVNVDAVRLLLSLRSPSQAVIFPCTNSSYGVAAGGEQVTEESPLNPISLYGSTKAEAERAVMDAGNAISLRLATNFGMSPRMRLDLLVNDYVYRAVVDRQLVVFDGRLRRNFVHVRDAAEAFLHVLRHFDAMRDQVYNVGNDEVNLSRLELCAEIAKHVPGFVYVEGPSGKDPDQRDYVVSNAKLRATGFRPSHSLQSGIAELVKGFRIARRTSFTNV